MPPERKTISSRWLRQRVAFNCIETFYAVLGDMQHEHSMGGPAFTAEDVLNRASQAIREAVGTDLLNPSLGAKYTDAQATEPESCG